MINSETTGERSAGGRLRRGTRRSPVTDVVLLSVVLFVVSLPVYWFLPSPDTALRPSNDAFIGLLAVLFGVSVVTVFHVEFRREALSFSLSEVPLILAAVFVAPVPGLLARMAGSIVALVIFRKPPLYKLFFNLSVFTLEISIVFAITRAMFGEGEDSDTVLIAGAVVATMAASVIGSVAVSVAISRFEGGTIRRAVDELKSAWVLLVNTATAGVLLGLALVTPLLAFLAVIPTAALWVMIRRHGEIAQQLRDLDEIHGFAGRIGESLDLADISHVAVLEAARLLRADVAILRIGTSPEEAQQFSSGPVPHHLAADLDAVWAHLASETETRLVEPSELLWAPSADSLPELIVSPINDGSGLIGMMLIAGPDGARRHFDANNVSHLKNLSEQLASSLRNGLLHRRMEFEARHDNLTGLPNRAAFETLGKEWTNKPSDDMNSYLLMLDLDRFKEVNDTLGHHAGDDLLIEFSRRISADLGSSDVIARLAGDEFAVLVRCADDESAFDFAQRCLDSASRPVVLDGLSVVVTASIGITMLLPTDTSAVEPMRRADIAMYNAKSHHVGIELYDDSLDRRNPARLSMLGDLRQAIENQHLGVEFQPKIDLETGMITGAEALVRWTHPTRGIVPPTDFVRVAEETGLIKQLTDLMLARGVSALRRFEDMGYHLGLSVNLSTHDLVDTQLPARVRGHLEENGVDPGALTLEITESSLLIDGPRARSTIDELDAIGVRLSIDDFGTGYSSLSYLRQLPVRELKIDQSFVTNMLIDDQDMVIVRSTIDLGHNLGLVVVAEGVESEEVLDRLRSFGCDVAQGYCVSRPLTAERFLAWLSTTTHPARRLDPTRPDSWADGGFDS